MRAPTSSQPQDEACDGQAEGDDDRSDGCFRFAGQVLGGRQLRLPASFQRASSLPRRFARSVTPTPAGREPEVRASARAELRAESNADELKSSKKRAASTSPSRNEFRRSLKERIPRQLRSLIPARMMPGYNLPPRPTRKAGPVGRTWVKVYDDITYMDDTSQEYYPIVGYTGAPVKVPEANPLPRAPTPPPPRRQRMSRRVSPTPSQISEYDNVPRQEQSTAVERNGSRKDTDQELILQEISNNRMRNINQEISSEERQQEADRELILKELTLKQMNGEKEMPDSNYENSEVPVERPTARKRENTRFKGRRQKRSGTPVATDRMTNGFNDENATDSGNQTFETIEYTSGESMKTSALEDEYIIPERKSSPPPRPKRGTKIYEGVSTLERPTPQTTETSITDLQGEQAEITDSSEVSEPTRPVRGVKVYETVHMIKTEDAPKITGQESTIDTPISTQTDAEEVKNSVEQKENVPSVETEIKISHSAPEENATVIVKPEKPKRGIKVYEDVNPCAQITPQVSTAPDVEEEKLGTEETSVEQSSPTERTSQEGESTEVNSEEQPAKEVTDSNETKCDLEEKPSKPHRGMKLYEDVVPLTTDVIKAEAEEKTTPSKPKRGVKLYEDVTVRDTNTAITSDEKIGADSKNVEVPSKPVRGKKVYSGVDFSDREKIVDSKRWEEKTQHEGIPPYATVQKGKDSQMKAASVGDDSPPPIPPKKRARQATALTEVVPPRPARHLKPRDRSADATRSSKRQKTSAQAGPDSHQPPQKPTRSSANKSKVKAEPIVGKVTLESGRTPEMSITTLDSESYENMVMSDPRAKFKSRPLPPTPGQTVYEGTSSTANTPSSILCPSGTLPGPDAPSAKETGLVIIASGESHGCNDAPQAGLTNARSISTADGVDVERLAGVAAASDGLECETQIINANTNTSERPLVSSESAVQSSKSNIDPDSSIVAEVSTQNNAERGANARTCEYCGHRTSDSQTEANVKLDQGGNGVTDVTNNVVQASLQFRSPMNDKSSGQDGVSVECIQTPCLLTAVSEPTVAECTERTTTDKLTTDKVSTNSSAIGNQVQSEGLTESRVNVDTPPLQGGSVVVQDNISAKSASVVSGKTDRKLSVAAEATIDFDECVTEALSGERSNADQCLIQSELNNVGKLSVAAETVEVNFVDESTGSLALPSAINSEKLKDHSEPSSVTDRRLSVAAESVIVNFVPESTESLPPSSSNIKKNVMQETPSTSFPEEKLSVAAEGITCSIGETADENNEIFAGIEAKMHSGDTRKMSIAAESINVESTPESTQALDTSIGDNQERSCASAESAIASVVSSDKQSTPERNDRKISVAAETVSLSMPESIQVLNPIGSDHESGSTCITSVKDSPSEEIGRKISIAAETVALEFMPESTQTLDNQCLETANVVATDENGASSVAAVSITTGNFADTVTNETNDNISTGGRPPNAVTEAPSDVLAQLSGNIAETGPTSPVNTLIESSCTTEVPQEASSLTDAKASGSLSGSQTSITDDDSVVSVVAKAEHAESDKEPTNTSSDSHDASKDASDATPTVASVETGDSNLKGGVTDINNRLEGISNFLDSVVRNFWPSQADNANDTPGQSDSSPSVGPVSTSSTNNSVPVCSVSVGVSATPELSLTNLETDDRCVQTGIDSQLQSSDKSDVTSSVGTSNQPALQMQTSTSQCEASASLPCANSSSPLIATSAADGAVPAVSEGTVSTDQKYFTADASQEDIVRKDTNKPLISTVENLDKREQAFDGSILASSAGPSESMVLQRLPVPSVFDLLDNGLGIPNESTSGGGSVLIFMDGEWHKL